MDQKKIMSVVLIIVGVAFLIYGLNSMDSPSSHMGAFFGKSDDKGMITILFGGVLSVVGLVLLLSKKSS